MDSKRILIVDDRKILRQLVECDIKKLHLGYQIVLAKDGTTALAELYRQPFDLMITDYNMPDMTGIELAQKVRQILPDMPIVLMTGQDIIETEAEVRRHHLQFDGYLSKPFSLAQLSRVLQPVKRKLI